MAAPGACFSRFRVSRLHNRMGPVPISLLILLLLSLVGCGSSPATAPTKPAAPEVKAAPVPQPAPAPAPAAKAAPAVQPAPAPKPAPAFDAEGHFRGKRITLIVPYDPGGGVDVHARSLAPLLGKHLPGNPQVVVTNQPGAGGVTALNAFYATGKPDGLSIMIHAAAPFNQVFADISKAAYDLRNMSAFGGFGETVFVYANSKRVKGPQDLYQRKDPLFVALRSVGAGGTVATVNELGALDFPFKIVEHPGGTSEARAALFRGEVDVFSESSQGRAIMAEIQAGNVVFLWQTGLYEQGKIVRDPRAASIPTFVEVYKQVTGRDLDGIPLEVAKATAAERVVNRLLLLPPKTPDDITNAFSNAFAAVLKEPEWQKATAVDGYPLNFIVGKGAKEAVLVIVDVSKPALDRHIKLWEKGTS